MFENWVDLSRVPKPITNYDALRDIQLIAGREMLLWKGMLCEIDARGEPVMLSGGVAGLEGASLSTGPSQPLPDALGAVTLAAGDIAPYNGVVYCPVPARGPVTIQFEMGYTLALAATPGTLLVTAGLGTTLASKNLGASVATATLGTSGTAFGMIQGNLSIRGTGSGTNARAYWTGQFQGKLATSGSGTLDVNQIFGYTALTYDSTAANGLWMTMTGTAATVSITTQQLLFGSWN
jgi:hypothetical protein